jgi:G3E family GTPase
MPKTQSQPKPPKPETGLILLSGFLGAGKTTLLKHILSWKQDMSDTVVIVNEFGDVGIDGSLLKDEATNLIELTSGCICCTLVLDLTSTLQKIWQKTHPRWIIVEASGLADPKAVTAALQTDEAKKNIDFFKSVTILDAELWQMREVMGQIFYHQLESADLLLLNKIDRLEAEHVARTIAEVREYLPDSSIVPTSHCRIDPESLLKPTPDREWGPDNHEHGHDTTTSYITFSFTESAPLNQSQFEEFIKELPRDIFRVKGTVNFGDKTVFLNYVGGQADWAEWPDKSNSRLVFIGWQSDANEALSRLRTCISES